MKYLILLSFLAACSSKPVQLKEKARDLKVYSTKPKDCRVNGRLVGTDKTGSNEVALTDALNKAADLNATGLFVNEEISNGKVVNLHATAYQCD